MSSAVQYAEMRRGRMLRNDEKWICHAQDVVRAWVGLNWDWSNDITGPPVVYEHADHERPRVTLDSHGDIAAIFVSTLVPTYPGGDASRLQVYVPRN